eukprot:7203195-Lingulodinium_polyedra.AAC.1
MEPYHHGILDDELCSAACLPRRTRWIAVRRKYNQAADVVATVGCQAAAAARRVGRHAPFTYAEWH